MRTSLKRWLLFMLAFALLCVLLYLLFSWLGWSAICRNRWLDSCHNVTLIKGPGS